MVSTLARHLLPVHAIRSKVHLLFSDKYLLLTNTGLTIGLSATGDLLQQRYEIARGRQTKWDAIRTRNILLSAVLVVAPVHYWYIYLDRFIPGRTLAAVLKKVTLDQLVMSPLCIVSFLGITGFLEGLTVKDIAKDIRTKGLALFKADWLVWPPAQVFQFHFLPTKYRILFDNCVCLLMDIYYYFVKYSCGWKGNQTDADDSLMFEMTCHNVRGQRRHEKRLYITHAFFF